VTTDDDVLHVQRQYRELDGGGNAAHHLTVRRYHVADVAGDEQVAG